MKTLVGLGWNCKWVTHLGCLQGCLHYLGVDVSDGWLFGATGHAFVLNVHDELCPSGPTAWKAEPIHRLGKGLGYGIDLALAFKAQEDFGAKQELAWQKTRAAIDAGLPCYGWELDIPEYYVIFGYDGGGYHFKGPGCDDGKGPKPWRSVGDTRIGVLEMYVVKPGSRAEDVAVVKAALQFAVDFARDASPWTFDGYTGGLAGYDTWITSLEKGSADGFGAAYNTAVWSECRTHAVAFLREAGSRLSPELQPLVAECLVHYTAIANCMNEVAGAFPFVHAPSRGDDETRAEGKMQEHVRDPERRDRGIAALRAAREAEAAGIVALEAVLAQL